jgi:glycosyltransferase involved in cell wall biosynthesis
VLHFHVDMLQFPLVRAYAERTVTTLHSRLDLPDLVPFYSAFRNIPLVSISDKPMVQGHPDVELIGEINEREKAEFLGDARSLLFPIDWPEPFDLVMIEANGVRHARDRLPPPFRAGDH